MNVYDQAHGLAEAIRQSEEYKQYSKLKSEIDADEALSGMINDFEEKQLEQQTKIMAGDEVPNDMMDQIQKLYQIVMADPKAAEYVQAQMRFSIMMSDVYKILGDAMGLVQS